MRNIEKKNISQGMLPGFSPPEKKTAKSKFITTEAHEAIFNAVIDEGENVQIKAVAGSGKTTTMIELVRRYREKNPADRILMTAFNRAIKEELAARTSEIIGVESSTINQMGYRALGAYLTKKIGLNWPNTSKRNEPYRSIFMDAYRQDHEYVKSAIDIMGKVLSHVPIESIEQLRKIEYRDVEWVIHHHGILVQTKAEPGYETIDAATRSVAEYVIKMINVRIQHLVRNKSYWFDEKNDITFGEQIVLPLILNTDVKYFDLIVVDEAQDLNRPQQKLLGKIVKKGAQIVAVGDPDQAIYGFGGADHMSMHRMQEEFSMQALPLSTSYRSPKSVLGRVKDFVPHFNTLENSHEGKIESGSISKGKEIEFAEKLAEEPNKIDMVVCRFNAQLIRLGKNMLKAGVPFFYAGKNFSAPIVAKIESLIKTDGFDGSIHGERGLLKILESDTKNSLMKIAKSDGSGKMSAAREKIIDIHESIECICDIKYKGRLPDCPTDLIGSYAGGKSRVGGLIKIILPDEGSVKASGAIKLCTIHKAKGLEANNVVIWGWNLMPSEWARQPWEIRQEQNMTYVALTRHKNYLFLAMIEKH